MMMKTIVLKVHQKGLFLCPKFTLAYKIVNLSYMTERTAINTKPHNKTTIQASLSTLLMQIKSTSLRLNKKILPHKKVQATPKKYQKRSEVTVRGVLTKILSLIKDAILIDLMFQHNLQNQSKAPLVVKSQYKILKVKLNLNLKASKN